jgi:hypothetical protein
MRYLLLLAVIAMLVIGCKHETTTGPVVPPLDGTYRVVAVQAENPCNPNQVGRRIAYAVDIRIEGDDFYLCGEPAEWDATTQTAYHECEGRTTALRFTYSGNVSVNAFYGVRIDHGSEGCDVQWQFGGVQVTSFTE